MSDEWAAPPPPKPRRRWPRRLAWGAAVFFVLLLALYFFLTSFTFLDAFVLPKVSQALNAKITLEDASIRPFFKVSLRGIKVQTGILGEPLLTAREARVRYSLFDIIGGHFNINEVLLDSPVINLTEDENGGTNLDPLLKSLKGETNAPSPNAPAKAKPIQLSVQNLTITNATLRRFKQEKDGGHDAAEVSNLNLSLSNLGNGQSARLSLGAEIKRDKTPGATATNIVSELLQAKLSGAFQFALAADLKPRSIAGRLGLDVLKAWSFADLSGLGLNLECDVTPSEIKQLSLNFAQKGNALGQIALTGPLDLVRQEGQLKLEISAIDRRVLNLVGARFGIDFGGTTIGSTNEFVLSNNGQFITASGQVAIGQLSVTQKNVTTRPLDLSLSYNIALNQLEKSAIVNSFTLLGAQDHAPFLRGGLARPMKLSFAGASNAVEESAFDLAVTNLNLADWRALVGDYTGRAGLTLHLLARDAGKKLSVELESHLEQLAANLGSNRIDGVDVTLTLRSQIADFQHIQLDECSLQVAHANQPALIFNSTGQFDVKSQEAELKIGLEAFLPRIGGLLGKPEIKPASGKLNLQAQLAQRNPASGQATSPALSSSVTGSLRLEDLSGTVAAYQFNRFETLLDFDVGLSNQLAEIRKFTGALKQAGQDGGSFELAGAYHLTNQAGQASFTLKDLNENVLRTFAAPALGEMRLASASLNLKMSAGYSAKGDSSLKTEFRATDLLIVDPKGQLPKMPLSLEATLDAAMRDGRADIHQFTGDVRQQQLPGSHFEVSGTYNLKKQAGQAALKVVDLNQNALRPLLASALGEKTLQSVSINLDSAASYDPKGESSVNAGFHLDNLRISDPKGQFPQTSIAADVKLNANLRNELAEIRELGASLKLAGVEGASLLVNGTYDLKKRAGHAALKLNDLNRNALGPFVGAALGDKKLASVSINAETQAAAEADGPASFKGKIKVSNFVVSDPAGKLPRTPLEVGLALDGAFFKQVLNLDQCQLSLSPTARARNELSLTGKVDLAKSNAITGQLQLAAESLDLTPYYDLFAGPASAASTTNLPSAKPPAPQAKSPAPPVTPTAPANLEPAPITLPLRQFVVGLNIGQLFLREIAISQWQAAARIDGPSIYLKPFQMTCNGAPISLAVDLNLGVPGYQYDVALMAERIPIEPFANTFMAGSRGQYKGDLISNVQIKGAGVTGASLQKNLSGNLLFSFTNANLQIASPRLKAFFLPVAILLQAPDLLNSPLNWVGASAQIGGGKIKLSQFNLVSDSFSANTQGDIRIAEVLMNSPLEKWPMHFYVRRAMAERLRLAPKNTPADAAYVQLPDFIKVAGTLGEPKAELNALALSGGVLDKVADKIGLKEKSGGLLDLLKGSK